MNTETLTIAVIAGTSRPSRHSIKAARYVTDFARHFEGVEAILVDPSELHLPGDGSDADAKDPRYSVIAAKADAFFIVTPEYNHSMPGSLKRLLDSEYEAYLHKPVALAGVSNGPWGGVRVCEALLPVCHRLGLVNILPELYFPKIQEIFDEKGEMNETFSKLYERNTRKSYEELIWFAHLLKSAREIDA